MDKLLYMEMQDFLQYLLQIKECQDECSEDVMKYFFNISSQYDSFEADAYEELLFFYAYCDQRPLFYDYGEAVENEEERDPDGEALVFSSDEMVEFYKLLKKLKNTKVITKKEYQNRIMEMETVIRQCILYTQGYGYDGLYCELFYARGRQKDRIEVLLDYNGYYSAFSLYCGVIMLFDKYKVKLQELKDAFCKAERLEAA